MRTAYLLIAISLYNGQAMGQAPESASLWRVSTASLTLPPALETGPVGLAWNPAAPLDRSRLSASVQVVQTSDVVGLSSVLVGLSRSIGRSARIGISGGRVDVRDLVRTTSSPTSVGTIPVYEQFLGLAGQYQIRGLVFGGLMRLHDARFNVERDHGFTFDVGARFRASSRLVVAAATHFLAIEFGGRETTDYYAGAEYLATPSFAIGGVAAQILLRYGATYSASERLEHTFGGGLDIGGHFRVDASVVREASYQYVGWRPTMAVSVRAGKYQLGLARSSGLNDLGATYRIGLDSTLFP